MKIQDAVALLTGATGGIGKAVARQLFANNATLILVGRDMKSLTALMRELLAGTPSTGRIYVCAADISTADGRDHLFEFVQSIPDRVNLMINSAGINEFTLFEQQSDEMLEKIITVNSLSPMLLIKQFMPYLARQHHVQIINVGSTFGSIGYPGYCAYSASKFALRGFTEALAREYANTPIKIKYFSPRATATDLNTREVVEMNKKLKVHMDSPDYVAEQLIKFIQGNAFSLYLGWPEKLFVKINQLFPGVVGKEIQKTLPVIQHYASL